MPHVDPDAPPGTIAEGGAFPKKGPGRPHKKLPMSSLLRVLKGIEDQALEGKSPDPSYSRKILADYAAITLERAFMADDRDIPLKQRADMALRIGPIIAMLETLIPKDGPKLPKTEAALDSEIQKRLGSLNALIAKKADVPVEAILDTLAPAAQAPPEEV